MSLDFIENVTLIGQLHDIEAVGTLLRKCKEDKEEDKNDEKIKVLVEELTMKKKKVANALAPYLKSLHANILQKKNKKNKNVSTKSTTRRHPHHHDTDDAAVVDDDDDDDDDDGDKLAKESFEKIMLLCPFLDTSPRKAWEKKAKKDFKERKLNQFDKKLYTDNLRVQRKIFHLLKHEGCGDDFYYLPTLVR
jgi:hypothetical protein